jgi:hypothetical protein
MALLIGHGWKAEKKILLLMTVKIRNIRYVITDNDNINCGNI